MAKKWAKRIWQAIDSVSTLAWLFSLVGGGAVLGVLYAWVGDYRHLSVLAQVFFGVAIFAAFGMLAVLVGPWLWEHRPLKRASSVTESAAEFDRYYIGALTEQRDALIKQRDALAKELTDTQKQVVTQQIQIKVRDDQLGQLKPKVDWADGLIERERSGFTIEVVEKVLWKLEALKADEPYFEIGVWFRYNGVLRLVIGDPPPKGKLSLDGEPFAREPEITVDSTQPLPFDRIGPTGGALRFRQYITPARAANLRSRLRLDNEKLQGHKGEVEFVSKEFHIPLRLVSFDGQVVRGGRLLGEYLEVTYMIEA